MKDLLFIDLETFSELDLKKVGTVKYCNDAEIMLAGFELNGVYSYFDYSTFMTIPTWVYSHIESGGKVVAHNALFEYVCLRKWFPELQLEQMIDTQAMCAAHGLPLALGKAGKALGLPDDQQKSTIGTRLITTFCKPRKPTKHNPATRVSPADAPEKWKSFRDDYLRSDIISMREVYKRLKPLSEFEQQVWVDTQTINLDGIPIDLDTVELIKSKLIPLVDDESSKFIRLTSLFPTQRDKVLKWVNEQGVKAPNLQAETVQAIIDHPDTPPIVSIALRHRANTTHMSFKKYDVMLAAINYDDHTVKGTLSYHAAHTGRFGGRLLQPQNLTRGSIPGVEAVERIQDGEFNVELVKSCVRPMIWHPSGFTIVDYSSIEARIVQWACCDENALEVFRSGQDPYIWMATKIYGVAYRFVTPAQRFCGKQAILGLGYNMSAKKFVEMIESYGESMSLGDAKKAVTVYRKTHLKLVAFWDNIQAAAVMAIQRPNDVIILNKHLSFSVEGEYLCMMLPSGRDIKYYLPRLETSFNKLTFTYMGTNDKSQYVRTKTYGGKLVENAVQAISRDILVLAVRSLMDKGYTVTTHIHDEIVVEGTHSVDDISNIMCVIPTWGAGMPIAAEGFNSPRYIKG